MNSGPETNCNESLLVYKIEQTTVTAFYLLARKGF